ncbi:MULTISPECIES: phosphoribosylglycinamide formyltransferase [Anaerotruncus]|uniref:phosphoribosylglycinamide formyltransferase n=1 Tax=Anaerotruncus TaxID=244127 RepID=UPI0008308565|nr:MULTISPECIES: phosphoribosylglycinamide formyltransferase [Anaerotruncus]RGX55855.1 phosphoribosylglycinamide formyltransferase [Anaerotruncus sp. AF02-27]
MKNVVVLVSGGGTNLQALIDAEQRGEIRGGKISRVISSNPQAYALERAKKAGILTEVLARRQYQSREDYDSALMAALERAQADLIVLAGFMYVLGPDLVQAYERRIINVHPSLIPSFCGDGFYGLRVHEAALAYGVKVTGATVHFVNEVTDGGQIILQKAVDVREGDTPEVLQKRVMEEAEWKLLPEAVSLFCEGKIQ